MIMKPANENFEKYIPELRRTGEKLCGSEICARDLVSHTLNMARKKRWKKSKDLPTDAWLTMLMMQQYLSGAAMRQEKFLH